MNKSCDRFLVVFAFGVCVFLAAMLLGSCNLIGCQLLVRATTSDTESMLHQMMPNLMSEDTYPCPICSGIICDLTHKRLIVN